MKEWKVIFNLGLIVLSSVAESQIPAPPPPPPPPASVITSRADSLVNEGDIKGAVAEYCRLAVANPQNRRILYNYACVLSVDHQADSAFRYLYLAQEMDPTAAALTDPDLINLRDDARWREFEDHTISLINKKTPASIKDTGYARELWRMLCLDQYSFFETGLAVRKLGPGSPVVSALRRLQELKNAGNLRDLEVLISEKGWPRRSEVGPEASSAAFYIIQHSNASAQVRNLPLFEKCCRENEADWRQYALMFDRLRINQNLPQRYGTHPMMSNMGSGKAILYPLENEEMVDEWRREIGLEPLAEFLKRANIEYQPGLTMEQIQKNR